MTVYCMDSVGWGWRSSRAGKVLLDCPSDGRREASILFVCLLNDGRLQRPWHGNGARFPIVGMALAASSFGWGVCHGVVCDVAEYYPILYPAQEKCCGNWEFYYTRPVPNSPHSDTVTVSFTLPRGLNEAVLRHAKMNLTNKSDIVRRALLAYLPPEEAAEVIRSAQSKGIIPQTEKPRKRA